MSADRPLRTRLRRPLKVAVQLAILGVIVATLGTIGFVQYSAQPGFCDNCHVMEPYYQSWASSTHRNVPCIQCHYAPGIKAEAMGKIQAANQVVKYITGTYDVKPWAEIEDAACLRSGCHSERQLEVEVNYRGVTFNHTQHLGELRRGKDLRCTSCHSQIVQGEHLTVTESTCFLCHFKDRPAGAPIGGCTGCHTSPPLVTSPAGFVVDHPRYVEELASCVTCHSEVTSGSGSADQARCFVCHNEPERIEQFNNTTLMHQVHLSQRNIECAQCHVPIEHRVVSMASTFELDCNSCHQGTHDEQRRLYAGVGGHATESRPSSMFLARVSCRACHELPTTIRGHERVNLAGEAPCLSCHGIRYANMLPSWQQEMDRKLTQITPVISAARRTRGAAPVRTRATVDSLLNLAQENVDFVRDAGGAHNIVYADELLRSALGLVRQAVQAGPLPYAVPRIDLGAPVDEGSCLRCHFGAERLTVEFDGGPFDHEPHTVRGGMACSECHTGLDSHGGTTLTDRAACDGCHHRAINPLNCAACHQGNGGAPATTFHLAGGNFSHQRHSEAGLSCGSCHVAPGMSAAGTHCNDCHEPHHRAESTCLECHRGGALEAHADLQQNVHVACTQCHDGGAANLVRWTRQICLSCHADMTDHNAPRPCADCHQIPAMNPADQE